MKKICLPLNTIARYGNIYIKCVEGGNCDDCYFRYRICRHCNESGFTCSSSEREDKTSVKFIEVVKPENDTKIKYKHFDLEEAKAGKEVCTICGHKARILCFDRKDNEEKNIIACILINNVEIVMAYDNNGYLHDCNMPSSFDLVMPIKTKIGYLNVYKENIYDSIEEANKHINQDANHLKIIEIEYE